MDVFLIENDELLKKYNTIQDKFRTDIKKEFDSEPVYNNEFVKTKIKYHGEEVTHFHDKEIPKVNSYHTCLAGIRISIHSIGFCSQVFLKECIYLEKKVVRNIYDNLSYSSSSNGSGEEQIKTISLIIF